MKKISILALIALCIIAIIWYVHKNRTEFQTPSQRSYVAYVTHDDIERTYLVHIPESYDASVPFPILMAFHGGFGSAEQLEYSSGLSELADKHGFIVVYGQGLSLGIIHAPVWNAGTCCGKAVEKNIDDVGYVKAVIKEMENAYRIDSDRIYITGMSNGGMFVQRLACEAADMFAGAASVAGTVVTEPCASTRAIPALIIHGTNDENVPYEGGVGTKAVNRIYHIPVEKEFNIWAERNNCAGAIVTTSVATSSRDGKTAEKLSYSGCTAPVALYRINGGIHEWPGGKSPRRNFLEKSEPTDVINASETIIDFFGLEDLSPDPPTSSSAD